MAKPFGATAARAIRTAAGKADSRVKLIGAVRAACRRAGILDEDRRLIQQQHIGKASLGDMTLPELGRMLDHLNKGWKGPMGHRGHAGKIRALWWSLYWLGAIDEPADPALDAFVKRQAGVSALRFLDHRKASSVIEALKAMAVREGVAWPVAGAVRREGADTMALDAALAERRAVVAALWAKLVGTGLFHTGYCGDYVGRALNVSTRLDDLGRHELDAAIKLLGKRLRRTLADRARREDVAR